MYMDRRPSIYPICALNMDHTPPNSKGTRKVLVGEIVSIVANWRIEAVAVTKGLCRYIAYIWAQGGSHIATLAPKCMCNML